MKEFEDYINKRLLEIEDLDKRKELRKVLDKDFMEICNQKSRFEEKWEQKIERNSNNDNEAVWILCGLANRKTYSDTCKYMYPVFEEDLKEDFFKTENVLESLENHIPVKIGSFFLKGEYKVAERLKNRKRPFEATVYTKNLNYHARLKIQYSEKYSKSVNDLIMVFKQNGYEWRTPCIPYFHRMFEIFLVETDIPWYEEILSMNIDYEEYERYMEKDWIPVWNLEKVNLITDVRPKIAGDCVVHRINPKRLEKGKQYLVANMGNPDLKCVRDRGINIYCNEKDPKVWSGFKVHREGQLDGTFEILSNRAKDTEVFPARTLGGIRRLFVSLDMLKRFQFMKIETGEVSEKVKVIIWVKNLKRDFIQDDIRFYLQAEMQRQYPEYEIKIKLY